MKLLRLLKHGKLLAHRNSITFATPSGTMHFFLHKESRVTKPLWLGLAVFFLVFCSSPVKKFIRMQLYRNNPVAERSASGAHLSTHDIKDCVIAERVDISSIAIPIACLNDGIPEMPQAFFLNGLAAMAFLPLFIKYRHKRVVTHQRWHLSPPMPRYLMVRHLQV